MSSHSRANNNSADLEHLELSEEVSAAVAEERSESSFIPLPLSRDSKRVSINSVDSNSSSSTVKRYPHHASEHPSTSSSFSPASEAAAATTTGSGVGAAPSSYSSSYGRRPVSVASGVTSGSSRRPSGPKHSSYRHSSAPAYNADAPNLSSSYSSRRRRSGARPPGSTRSSIRHRNRSSDIDEEDESYQENSDEHESRSNANRPLLRRGSSRRSFRFNPEDEDNDLRSTDDRDHQNHQNHRGEEYIEEEDDDDSEAEPLTLKDRQETLNQTHPFGLPLWKPALYKKSRSVTRNADSALHSQPSSEFYLSIGNLLWTLVFGWWLALICFVISIILFLTPFGGSDYGRVVLGLSFYLFWPFGQYVERELSPGEAKASGLHTSANSDYSHHHGSTNGNGHDYSQGNGRLSHLSPPSESRPLLSRRSSYIDRERERRQREPLLSRIKKAPRSIYDLGLGGIVYYIFYYLILGPLHLIVSCFCWFMVVSIPMGKFTYVLATHLHKNPLRLHFKRGSSLSLSPQQSEILLCTYDAIGLQYYKYTYDGTNIIFINLMPIVFFTILDEYVLTHVLGHDSFLTSPKFIFSMGLASVIPLSYFIGMAVSSISAQSSLGMGAVINATFGSIIEIILYSVALTQGKGLITVGALIGSFLAGLLLMPGVSMMGGAVKKKEQKFNAKSAGVTATMLIMALIGVLTPTLFYDIYGRFELHCTPCPENVMRPGETSCERCYYQQPNPLEDEFFQKSVRPLMYLCCIILPSAYLIGIWFSLRTHVKQIWHEPQPASVRDSSIYKKLLPMHILQQLIHYGTGGGGGVNHGRDRSVTSPQDEEMGQFNNSGTGHSTGSYQSTSLHGGLHDRRAPQGAPMGGSLGTAGAGAPPGIHPSAEGLFNLTMEHDGLKNEHGDEGEEEEEEEAHGGHDSPNWSKGKSATVLLGCTVLYSIIAEILVDSVDAVSSIDEKLLGLTLFALVPNVTEFMNAISFAMYGNIALSMEIGSAYALQVCLIQIPAMVAVSVWLSRGKEEFLLTYTYIEGKSNYFKGSILILSYCVLMSGFFFAPTQSHGVGEVGIY
ncbi:hypothetical protein BGW38_002088 [Lunasporangiospora selenospora]|uniref:Ca2+:H+ antiporter n=1 Tax=Lunasporangiospora selenospora TaxID=979761 RepID=A0A9P6G109_9FUNG|nr:hypothetical protein BGW38_002088 [Lunasporangiospora selenospora]